MLKYKHHIYLLGLLAFVFVFDAIAQIEADTISISKYDTGIFEYKEFLNSKMVAPFWKMIDKSQSPYSSSSVSSKDLRSINTLSLGNTLAGRLTGLMVSKSGGNTGDATPTLQLRGVQSFVDPSMMVVVDGFQTEWNTLLPDEIESVQVLKDAASLAQYGISGANGVLYIKTKRGVVRDRSKVIFNSRVSLQQPTVLPEFLGNDDYAELYNIALMSDGKDISNGYFSSQEIVDYFKNGTYPVLYPDVDWYSEILKPSTITQDYDLSINGGNESSKYNVLLGFSNNPGLYGDVNGTTNSNYIYNRYVSRINLDVKITDWLHSQISTRAMVSTTKQPNVGQTYIWNAMGKFLPFNVQTPSGEWGGTEGYPDNPVALIKQKGYTIRNSRTIDANVKVIADILFISGLSAFGQVVFSNNYYSDYNKTRGYSYEELFADISNPGEYTSVAKGDASQNFSYAQPAGEQWNRTTGLGGLEYNKSLTNGSLYASAIYSAEVYNTVYTLDFDDFSRAKINMFGRVNYMHKNKYIAEFGYSYSGTENYVPGKRFGFFPAISGAWIMSNEDFMNNKRKINFLKVRASYGMVGNDGLGSLPRFMFHEYYGSPSGAYRIGNLLNSSESTYEIIRFANPDATWEKAYKTNIGVDVEFYNKLSLSADYFHEKRKDIFVDPENNLSAVIGGRYNFLNQGEAKNSGAELELFYKDKIGSLGYYAGARFSYVKTEVVDMKEPPRAYDYLNRKGHPIGQPFVLEAIGFFKDQDDIDNSPFQSYGTVKPGDVKYKDQNEDGTINDNDQVAIGDTWYPGIIYSFDLGLDFKGFDFSIFFQGVGKRTISLLNANYMIPFLDNRKPVQWIADNYWTPQRGDAALYPRLTTESNTNNYKASSLWQRDGSYFRIKNIELGYSLPSDLTKRIGISGLRVYVNAVEPIIWDKIDEIEIDPEINNPYAYPSMKSYNLGFTLNF